MDGGVDEQTGAASLTFDFGPNKWAKVGAFGVVGLLSIKPTVRILAWQKSLKTHAAFIPPAGELQAVRRCKLAEIHVFALIPVAAAIMARGISLDW